MKNSGKNLRFGIALFVVLVMSAYNVVSAQTAESQNTAGFLILVETTKDGIKLTGKQGCAWTELSFTYKSHSNQAIDQGGMTTLNPGKDEKSSDPDGFLFTINKTKDGLSFEGLAGTSWKKLSFTCPNGICHQYIDQNGMTQSK